MLAYVLFILGLILIIRGGDYFVDSATWTAEVSGIPKFIIGTTIVSVATTIPELIVSSIAASQGKVDMSIGNAVGSVTANTGMILGLFIVCMPFTVKLSEFAFKAVLMFCSAGALLLLCMDGQLTVWRSLVLLALFAAFLIENLYCAKRDAKLSGKPEKRKVESKSEIVLNLVKFIGGAAGIVVGAQLLVTYGTEIAESIGVSQRVISVVAISIGTSLPELVTTVTALRKGQSDISVGNILGANIIDLTLILPICAVISGGALPVQAASINIDMPVCLGIIAITIIPTLLTKKFMRWQGIVTMGCYFTYLAVTIF
ncbi:MAG: calcium/sodium antiporter [Clostridiales bacterium]|nr:calcium/sodium antiporter [Clostridiales bacterium]